ARFTRTNAVTRMGLSCRDRLTQYSGCGGSIMIAAAHSPLWALEPKLPTGNIAWNWTAIRPADTIELASWMHPWELARLSFLSSPARRASFLAGRWAAKQLLAAVVLM